MDMRIFKANNEWHVVGWSAYPDKVFICKDIAIFVDMLNIIAGIEAMMITARREKQS